MADNLIAREQQFTTQRTKPSGKLKAVLPGWLLKRMRLALNHYRLVGNYFYDWRRFIKHSALGGPPRTAAQLEAYLTMDYHSLEKGLALKKPRLLFGQARIQKIISSIHLYSARFGPTRASHIAINTLEAYQAYHHDRGSDLPTIKAFLEATAEKKPDAERAGGTLAVTKASIHERGKCDLKDFFYSRYSVRHFSDEPVATELIEQAVVMAQKSPSVCNRQASRVHLIEDRQAIKTALKHQNGNRGFSEQIGTLVVVTADLQAFVSSGERNQAWIDGGMFAMTLVYGLHSLGLGSCCLNWSADRKTDKALRRDVALEESEAVIMMIAVGHLPEQLNVAQSPRKHLDEVLIPQ